MTACVRGCVVPRGHIAPCTCTHDCPDHDGHCRGCQPRDAEHGLLCSACSRRLRDHLGARERPEGPHGLPWAYDHLAAAHPYIATPAATEGGSGKRAISDPEAERLANLVALRAEIRDTLATLTADVAEVAGLSGPADVEVFTDRPPIGPDRLVVRRCCDWLLRRVDSLEASPAVVDAWDALGLLMSRAHALAPWRPAPTLIDGVPCRCMAFDLHHHGDEVKCWACARAYSLDEYAVLVKVMARRFGTPETGADTLAS